MILRIKEFAVIENASPDTVVNLVPITEGPEGAAVFGVSNEHNTDFKIGAGQTYIDRANPTFNIAVLRPDSSDVTQLETWASDQTAVFISALTLDGGFFFGDRQTSSGFTGIVKIRTNQTLTDNDVYVFEVTLETTPGFDPTTGQHQSGFWAGENLAGGYEWGDKDSDGLADGWGLNGLSGSNSFSSGQQTIEQDTSSAYFFDRTCYLPFPGQQLTYSINVDSLSGSYDTNQIEIGFDDVSNSFVSSSSTNISSTGRKSVTATIPDTTARVTIRHRANATSGTVTTVLSDPALKLGTDSTYSKF